MIIFGLLVCAFLVAIDQITKYYAVLRLKPVMSLGLIPNLLDLTYVENTGMAFGLMPGGRWVLVGLTVIVLIGIAVYYLRLPRVKNNLRIRIALLLIVSGALGNLIDRIRNGYVVDFFHTKFMDFPVFNVADSYVVVGTIFLAVLLLFFVKEDGDSERRA